MSETLKTLPVWHEGETYLQQKVGVAERMAAVGQRVIRDFMPDQHRDFYAQLPFIVLGSVDRPRRRLGNLARRAPGLHVLAIVDHLRISRPEEIPATPQAKAWPRAGRSAFLAWRCTQGAATA